MLKITQSKLMELLNKVQAAVDSRANISSAYGCVYISSNNGKLSVCATNQSIEINTFSPRGDGIEFEDGLSFVLPGKKLISIVKQASSDTEVKMKDDGNNGCIMTFGGMRSKFKLVSLPADDFPKVDVDKKDAAYFTFNPEVLTRTIDTVEPAVAVGDVRFYLNGLNLSIKGDVASLNGTDGHRLLTNKMNVTHMKGVNACNVIIPKESIKPMYSLLKAESEECAFSFSANHVQIKLGYTIFTSKLIDGVYPDPLVKMAIIHHQFESIHPFYDGNGRTGRILNILYLVTKDLLNLPVLYLSRFVIKNKADYYANLQAVRDTGNWVPWLEFMLDGVIDTARDTISLITAMKTLMAEVKHGIREQLPKIYSQDLLNNLFNHPYTKIDFIVEDLGVTRITATKYLEQLVEHDFLIKQKVGRVNYYINEPLCSLLVAHG